MSETKISDVLKKTGARLSIDNYKWLVWDDATNEWVVYYRGKYKRISVELIRTESEQVAVKILCAE